MEEVYFFGDYLIFSDRYSFCQLNLNTGGMFDTTLCFPSRGLPALSRITTDTIITLFPIQRIIAWAKPCTECIEDIEEGVLGEAEEIGKVPLRDDEDVLDFWEKYYPSFPKVTICIMQIRENIYRLSINDGEIEKLTSYDDSTYNRFALCENGTLLL